MTTQRTVVVVGVVVLGVALAVVGIRALGIGRHRTPVALIGDSITANVESAARSELGHDYALTVDGRPGYRAEEQRPAAESAARFPFDQIVVNLGTNDVLDPEQDLDQTMTALAQIIDGVSGIRCVHVVTVGEGVVTPSGDGPQRAARVNAGIRLLAARHPNVHVIDWATIVRDEEAARGEAITTDTVHPNAVGNRVLADAYGESLDACAS